MFSSFFPKPKWFFLSAFLWACACILAWYGFARDLGHYLSLGGLFGYGFPPSLTEAADDAAKAAFNAAQDSAINIWLYQFMIAAMAAFCAAWTFLVPHRWQRWSVLVSTIIIFTTWFQVQLDVMINNWFGTFYNLIQKALGAPNSITQYEFYSQIATFGKIAAVWITVAFLFRFVISHYVFRWRTAMNDYYVSHWPRLRRIEGASQRIQEDTMRFATITENLGVSLVDAVMTLIAFLPILWTLSRHVTELPLIGAIPQPLVFVAILWSVFGTALLALAGIRLPGLEFRNQRVEAAYRKE